MTRTKLAGLGCAIACGTIGLLPVSTTAGDPERLATQQERAWRSLRTLVGQWHTSNGERDTRTNYRLIANGNYLASETVSVSRSEQDVHSDLEVFSYDAAKKRVMMRQFVSEGVICRYKLDEISSDGKTLTFVTEHCEGGSPTFAARATYGILSSNEYTTKLELARSGQGYMPPCVDVRLRRVE